MPLKPEKPVFRRAKGTPPPPVVEAVVAEPKPRKKAKFVKAKAPKKAGASILASKTYGLISAVRF